MPENAQGVFLGKSESRGQKNREENVDFLRNPGSTFYQLSGGGYTVVSPPPSLPVGTLLGALPAGITVTYVSNTMYYVDNGVYYQLTMSDGRTMYVVTKPGWPQYRSMAHNDNLPKMCWAGPADG